MVFTFLGNSQKKKSKDLSCSVAHYDFGLEFRIEWVRTTNWRMFSELKRPKFNGIEMLLPQPDPLKIP